MTTKQHQMSIKHYFNEYGKVDTQIRFKCAVDAIDFGAQFKEWSVRPIDEKNLKKGFLLTIKRNP